MTLAYVNLVGANDGLIFDGGGLVFQNGRQVLDVPRFSAGVGAVTVDLDRTRRLRGENTTWRMDRAAYLQAKPDAAVRTVVAEGFRTKRMALRYPVPSHKSFFLPPEEAPPSPRALYCEELLDALALGVGDYFEKTPVFRCLGVALSGGRDSLLTLLVAHRYASACVQTRRAVCCGLSTCPPATPRPRRSAPRAPCRRSSRCPSRR